MPNNADRLADAGAVQDRVVDLEENLLWRFFAKVTVHRRHVFHDLLGEWHKRTQLVQLDRSLGELRLALGCGRSFAVPSCKDAAARLPGRGFIHRLREVVALASDLVAARE